jgi:hypothetical protein
MGKPDTGVAGGALDHGSAGLNPPIPLGRFDDTERGTVLDRPTRVHELGFPEDLAAGFLADPLEADERRVAHRTNKAVSDIHVPSNPIWRSPDWCQENIFSFLVRRTTFGKNVESGLGTRQQSQEDFSRHRRGIPPMGRRDTPILRRLPHIAAMRNLATTREGISLPVRSMRNSLKKPSLGRILWGGLGYNQ